MFWLPRFFNHPKALNLIVGITVAVQLQIVSTRIQAQQIQDLPPAATENDPIRGVTITSLPPTPESTALSRQVGKIKWLEKSAQSKTRELPGRTQLLPSTKKASPLPEVECKVIMEARMIKPNPPTKLVDRVVIFRPMKPLPSVTRPPVTPSRSVTELLDEPRDLPASSARIVHDIPAPIRLENGTMENTGTSRIKEARKLPRNSNPLRQKQLHDQVPKEGAGGVETETASTRIPFQSINAEPDPGAKGFSRQPDVIPVSFNSIPEEGVVYERPISEIRFRPSQVYFSGSLRFAQASPKNLANETESNSRPGRSDPWAWPSESAKSQGSDSGRYNDPSVIAKQSATQVFTRHPLATNIAVTQEEPRIPTIIGAPDRASMQSVPSLDPPTLIDRADMELIQPPIQENKLSPYGGDPTQVSRDQFWRQFSTMPNDDATSRTEGYGSIQAILKNGFWFAGADLLYFEPTFQQNNAFTVTNGNQVTAQHVDFGFDISARYYLGFETNAGPGFKLSYWNLNKFSAINDVVFVGGQSAVTRIDLGDSGNQILVGDTANAGSRLTVQQQIELNSTEVTLYKDQKNPVSSVIGNVGLRHISLTQRLFVGLDDPVAGSDVVRNVNGYYGFGPRIGVEYFRPVGHTRLELRTGLFGSLIFGRRDQTFVQSGSTTLFFNQIGKVESISIIDAYLGIQWNKKINKCQTVFFSTAIESQWWGGADSAMDTGTDLGLYGMTFGFGISR